MKFSKKFLAVAAAGALTVATAVPALALENEIHGTFTSYYDLSNYTQVGNDGSASTAAGTATGLHKGEQSTENYFVQRVRLGYTAKASDNVKLMTNFELDYSFWGNSSYTVGRNSGGGLGADSVNLETKSLYLELNYPSTVTARIGMQPYNDSYKGVLFDADMAGVLLSHEYSKASVAAGFFRFSDKGGNIGRNTNDMISLDAKYSIFEKLKVGGSYYYINDNRPNAPTITGVQTGVLANGTPVYATGSVVTTSNPDNAAKVHNIGLNADGFIGPLNLNGFALLQVGDLSATKKAEGYSLNVGAKLPVLGGTARSEFLYVSGGKNSFYIPQSPIGSEGGGFYDAEMIMLQRDKYDKTIDSAIIYNVNNYDQGVIFGSLGYDYAFTDKLSGSVNAGFAAVAKNTLASGTSDYLGTEMNAESNYKLSPNVTLGVRGGYVVLGDYFKGLNADNPYDLKILANLAF